MEWIADKFPNLQMQMFLIMIMSNKYSLFIYPKIVEEFSHFSASAPLNKFIVKIWSGIN